jgi:hypothetical protein
MESSAAVLNMRYGHDVLEHGPLLGRGHPSSCLACDGVQSRIEASLPWRPRIIPLGRRSLPAARRQHRRVDWDGWPATAHGQPVTPSWSGTLIAGVRSVDVPSEEGSSTECNQTRRNTP